MKSPEFVVHGTASDKEGEQILEQGLHVKQGRATVSADLIYAAEWATDAAKRKTRSERKYGEEITDTDTGRIVVMCVPDDKIVDYGKQTAIDIDDVQKTVSGYTMKWIGGRKQSAFFHRGNVTAQRKALDAKTLEGEHFVIPADHVLLGIVPTPELVTELNRLREEIQSLHVIDYTRVTDTITKLLLENPDNFIAPDTAVQTIIGELIYTTIQTEVVNFVRSLSHDVKVARGYTIINRGEVKEKTIDREDLLGRLDQLCERINEPSFSIGMTHLDQYIKQHVPALRRELIENA